jgi:hypothetical protein
MSIPPCHTAARKNMKPNSKSRAAAPSNPIPHPPKNPANQSSAGPARVLPLMQTFEDAAALYDREKDPFYLAAFMIQLWLGGLVQSAAAEYAEKKNPRERSVQSSEAWRSLRQLFNLQPGKACCYLLSCLFRFCAVDNSPRNSLRRALVPLSIEHDLTGDYLGPKTMHLFPANSQLSSQNSQLVQRTITRWCDWLDAAIHLRTHRHWHAAPDCFDPDPEKRELAALGNAQRHLASLDLRAQAAWLLDFAAAAEEYKNSPKWAALGKSMAAESDRLWQYPEVDTFAIAMWPLVKAYNWTYRDLLNVLRSLSQNSPLCTFNSALNRYPCDSEQDFAAYCANVLGLRKTTKGATAANGRPVGYELAKQLFPPPPEQQCPA